MIDFLIAFFLIVAVAFAATGFLLLIASLLAGGASNASTEPATRGTAEPRAIPSSGRAETSPHPPVRGDHAGSPAPSPIDL